MHLCVWIYFSLLPFARVIFTQPLCQINFTLLSHLHPRVTAHCCLIKKNAAQWSALYRKSEWALGKPVSPLTVIEREREGNKCYRARWRWGWNVHLHYTLHSQVKHAIKYFDLYDFTLVHTNWHPEKREVLVEKAKNPPREGWSVKHVEEKRKAGEKMQDQDERKKRERRKKERKNEQHPFCFMLSGKERLCYP